MQARKLLSNEFAVIDFPANIRSAIFDFLGHSGDVNSLHYCAPGVGKILLYIASALQRISDKFDEEDITCSLSLID